MATNTEPIDFKNSSMSLNICPGCHSSCKSPLFLPCCHTVCRECVEVTNSGLSRCPKCQSEIEAEPSSLRRDVTIERVVAVASIRQHLEENGTVVCSECEEGTSANYFCLICTTPICELDLKLHRRLYKETHQVVSLEEFKLKSLEQLYPRNSVQCSFHAYKAASDFCRSCKLLLCAYCQSHHHPDHRMVSVQEAEEIVSALSKQQRETFKTLGSEDYRNAQNFLEKVARMRADLEIQFEDMKRVLDERKTEVIGKLDIIYKDTLRVIQKGERWREHIRDLIEKSSAYEHLPMDENLLTDLEHINTTVGDLLKRPPDRTKYRDIEFIMDQDVKCMMKALGCFRLKYMQDIIPENIIETTKHNFTPFTITIGNNNLLYNFTIECEVVVMNREWDIIHKFKPSNLRNIMINTGFIHWNKARLYIVAGKKNSVTVCTETGELVKVFGKEGSGKEQLDTPISIAVSNHNGDIYVLEQGNNRIQVFNSHYQFHRFIGHYIDTAGQIKNPCELALTPQDEVLVAQRNIPSINIYNSQGDLLKQFGSTSLDGQVCMIGAMSISHRGQVILTDVLQNQVIVYDSDLTTMWTVGRTGKGRGEYLCPGGVVCLEDGSVYVCDIAGEKIQVYQENSLILGYN